MSQRDDLRALSDAATEAIRLAEADETLGSGHVHRGLDRNGVYLRWNRDDADPVYLTPVIRELAASPSPATDREDGWNAALDALDARMAEVMRDVPTTSGGGADASWRTSLQALRRPSPATAFEAEMAENREHMASDFGEGRSDGEPSLEDEGCDLCLHDGIEDASDCPRAGA